MVTTAWPQEEWQRGETGDGPARLRGSEVASVRPQARWQRRDSNRTMATANRGFEGTAILLKKLKIRYKNFSSKMVVNLICHQNFSNKL